jgi:predicted ester cyclase
MRGVRFRLSLTVLLSLAAVPVFAAAPPSPPTKAAAPPAAAADAADAGAAAALQANKALVRRYIDDVLTANKQEELEQLLSPDFVDSTPSAEPGATGPEVIRAAQERIHAVFPKVRYQIEDLIAEGDKVVARYTVRASTREPEGGRATPVEITGMTIFRIADGKIREAWIINDQVELYRQLGFTIQPPSSSTPNPPANPSPHR